jgi:hypothetical protein
VGHRALGLTGRSLLNILEDASEMLRQCRARKVPPGMQGTRTLPGGAGLPAFPQGVYPAGAMLAGQARPRQGGSAVPPPAEEGASAESAGGEITFCALTTLIHPPLGPTYTSVQAVARLASGRTSFQKKGKVVLHAGLM